MKSKYNYSPWKGKSQEWKEINISIFTMMSRKHHENKSTWTPHTEVAHGFNRLGILTSGTYVSKLLKFKDKVLRTFQQRDANSTELDP